MLIRISGGADGIKEYLEEGQKQGRDQGRDALDERQILFGDLEATNEIIQKIRAGAERYMHVTISFKEDEVDRRTLQNITQDFRAFAMSAYQKNEHCFYAEAHMPRVKSYTDKRDGSHVERKPHIHIVIPKMNLVSGGHLNPFAVVPHNIRFVDAFQEHINAKYGLASPKDHRRIEFTGASEMISRYKGDLFDAQGRDLKTRILDAMVERKIDNHQAFQDLVAEFGEVRTRNAGKASEYLNVKEPGAARGVNLKDHVFTRAFVELSPAEKTQRLAGEIEQRYETAGPPRQTPQEISDTLKEWHATRARELKHINSGNRRLYAAYKAADPEQRLEILARREAQFDKKHRQEVEHERENRRGRGIDTRSIGHDRERGPFADTERAPPRSLNNLRSLSGLDMVRIARGSEVLLQSDARHQLGDERAERTDGMRWIDYVPRGPGVGKGGRPSDSVTGQLIRDNSEARQARDAAELQEFREIRAGLDARRLLAELSQSHGLMPERFEITKGQDGGDRIRAGTRNLNVSDFLTKEMNLTWDDTAQILRGAYARQLGQEPSAEKRQAPRRELWTRFQDHWSGLGAESRDDAWQKQRESEATRKDEIRKGFYARRSRIQSDHALSAGKKRAAVSVARLERRALEDTLREKIKTERQELKAAHRKPVTEHYRDYLTDLAHAGDEEALAELRRMRPEALEKERENQATVRPGAQLGEQDTAKIYRAPRYTFDVRRNGTVTYNLDGRAVIRDTGPTIKVLRHDSINIETGLRLAMEKYGKTLTLTGSDTFQKRAASVAAAVGLDVSFADPAIQKHLEDRRKEIKRGLDAPEDPNHQRGHYSGRILRVDRTHVYQDAGRGVVVRHRRSDLDAIPTVGQDVSIAYSRGRASLKQRGIEHGMER